MGFIFATVAIDMLGFGLIIPVLPRLIETLLGGDTASAAWVFGLFGTVFALMQFVAMPILGGLSDRFGRRPVILISNAGLCLDYVLMALAPGLAWLLVGRIITGICAATVSTAFAYITDITPPERRARAFGLVGVAFGLGFVLGPAVGGLLGAIDLRLPFWVAAGLAGLNFLYGWLVLPESLARADRRAFSLRRASPFGTLALLRRNPGLLGLAGVHFLRSLAHTVLPAVFVLYAGFRYGWDEATVGLTLAGVGAASALVQGVLVGPAVARFGERTTLLIGLGFGAAGMAAMGLAPSAGWMWAAIPILVLWDLSNPALQGLATRQLGADGQGELQGAFGSLQAIAGLFGPGIFAATFAGSLYVAPGSTFLLAGAMCAAAAGLAAWTTRPRPLVQPRLTT